MALVFTIQFLSTLICSLYTLFVFNKWIQEQFDIEYDERLLSFTFGILNNVMNENY